MHYLLHGTAFYFWAPCTPPLPPPRKNWGTLLLLSSGSENHSYTTAVALEHSPPRSATERSAGRSLYIYIFLGGFIVSILLMFAADVPIDVDGTFAMSGGILLLNVVTAMICTSNVVRH